MKWSWKNPPFSPCPYECLQTVMERHVHSAGLCPEPATALIHFFFFVHMLHDRLHWLEFMLWNIKDEAVIMFLLTPLWVYVCLSVLLVERILDLWTDLNETLGNVLLELNLQQSSPNMLLNNMYFKSTGCNQEAKVNDQKYTFERNEQWTSVQYQLELKTVSQMFN